MFDGVKAAGTESGAFPVQRLEHLDALWIQIAGTLCNLTCAHCFVPSGPGIDRHRMMPRDEVRRHVIDAVALGAREFYFTGGEPFLHPELLEILEDTLAHGPCTVLTNGVLFTSRRLARLQELSEGSRYSLEIRVSLDGLTAEQHDSIRGSGTFERVLDGLRSLERHGLLPIVTVTRSDDDDPLDMAERSQAMLRAAGLERPRLKLLPLYRLGREAKRSRSYDETESLAGLDPAIVVESRLPCSACRAVTSRGVFVCPLLVDSAEARLGARLAEATGPFELSTGACFTCLVTGSTCSNA